MLVTFETLQTLQDGSPDPNSRFQLGEVSVEVEGGSPNLPVRGVLNIEAQEIEYLGQLNDNGSFGSVENLIATVQIRDVRAANTRRLTVEEAASIVAGNLSFVRWNVPNPTYPWTGTATGGGVSLEITVG